VPIEVQRRYADATAHLVLDRGPPHPKEDQEQGSEEPARPAASDRPNVLPEYAGQDAETRGDLATGGGTHIAPT